MESLIFYCHTCAHENQNKDTNDDYEQTTYESFSDAWTHMFYHQNHYMELEKRTEPED